MTTIAGVRGALPEHSFSQQAITDALADWCLYSDRERALLRRFHENAQVRTRHMAVPLERYRELTDFGASNDVYIEQGTRLGVQAVTEALAAAGLAAADVDLIVFTTVTGVVVPSLDALIAPVLGLRPDVKRMPLFGLGCVAGAAGIARVHDYLQSHPDEVAVLLSVELCSLTMQPQDRSAANMVATGLFGDGAAAVVLVGANRAERLGIADELPQVVDSRSHLYPHTERIMGWDVGSSGLKIVLDADVPVLVEKYLAEDVALLLEAHQLHSTDIAGWVCHPGGPKVIEAIQRTLDLHDGELDLTWRSLASIGNLSSSSVLHVLADTVGGRTFEPGSPGLLMAMGPGFCSEVVLLRW